MASGSEDGQLSFWDLNSRIRLKSFKVINTYYDRQLKLAYYLNVLLEYTLWTVNDVTRKGSLKILRVLSFICEDPSKGFFHCDIIDGPQPMHVLNND